MKEERTEGRDDSDGGEGDILSEDEGRQKTRKEQEVKEEKEIVYGTQDEEGKKGRQTT